MIEKILFVPSEYIYTDEDGELSPVWQLIPDAVSYGTMWARAYVQPEEQEVIDKLDELGVIGYELLSQEEAMIKANELSPIEEEL